MGMAMIAWLVALRAVSKRYHRLRFVGALGPISACVIGARAPRAARLCPAAPSLAQSGRRAGAPRSTSTPCSPPFHYLSPPLGIYAPRPQASSLWWRA